MIFSVMASPNRIDILRILNTKGPLTYSELKSLAGFRSKKESGKFAYHLRKLLRQSLVGLNKAERRYAITNLGKLVLTLARQIEEKSIIESGKMYVRTTNQTMEEFNPHKIIQSLVKEANMSLEQSTKITEEVENKIYKFSTSYLTSRLIRDCVNSVLLEHGLEEQMNKLIRVGIPTHDLTKKLNNIDGLLKNGVNDLIIDVSKNVFSDYFRNSLHKDVLDMHFNGEIHLGDLSNWGMLPDTLFIDFDHIDKNLNLKGNFLFLPRVILFENMRMSLPLVISLLQREVSKEIVIENYDKIFYDFDHNKISEFFAMSMIFSSTTVQSTFAPIVTLVISIKENDLLQNLLNGYLLYLEKVPIPIFGLAIKLTNSLSDDILLLISKIVNLGGRISLSRKPVRSSRGVFKLGHNELPIVSLHSLSINLPRLAYQSNKDETYFRTKLALLIKPSLNALISKKDLIMNHVQKNLFPTLSNTIGFPQLGSTDLIINLSGLNESIFNVLEYSDSEGLNIIKKVIKTSNDVISDFAENKMERFGISIINDNSSSRFVNLDSEKFGKLTHELKTYSQGLVLTENDLENDSLSKKLVELDNLLTGGFYIGLDTTGLSSSDIVGLLSKSCDTIPYFEILNTLYVCFVCGSKVLNNNVCSKCGSRKLVLH